MVIYADLLVLTNLYIDFILMMTVRKLLQFNISYKRALAGAVAGALTCPLLFILPDCAPLQLLFALISALTASLAAVLPCGLRVCLKLFCALFIAGFLLAGLCLIVLRFLPLGNVCVVNGRLYFNVSPATLFLATLFSYTVLCVLRKFSGAPENPLRFMRIKIKHAGRETELFARADTGNALVEPFSGLPVIVAERSVVGELFSDSPNKMDAAVAAKSGVRLIAFSSLGGGGMLYAFRPESLRLSSSQREVQAYIAVYDGKLSHGQYNAVFNPDKFSEYTENIRRPKTDGRKGSSAKMKKFIAKIMKAAGDLISKLFKESCHYINGPESLPAPLTKAEEADVFSRIRAGEPGARDPLIVHNLRLVVYIAKKFESPNSSVEDLISIGTIGLIKAVNTFSLERNIKLATYASRCIENEILMYLRKTSPLKNEVSIDDPLNVDWDGNELLLSDLLGSEPDAINIGLEQEAEKDQLLSAIDRLPSREKLIMRMRFGLEHETEHTQKEVADELGISQSYISRLEKRIISRLKKEMAASD